MKIVFYDGECPLCNRAVRHLLTVDKKRQFYYASLQGETAAELLHNPSLDSLVLYEGKGKIFIEGRAVLRICWHLGGKYALLGWLSFLPPYLFNLGYRLVARYRYRLFSKITPIEKTDRFLP